MPKRIILDTDIGTDVDDCLALALILGSLELQLEGVTCVYGDVNLRARMAMKLLAMRGLVDVPVMVGASKPLMGLRDVYWEGHEGQGLLEVGDEQLSPSPEFASDYIVRVVMNNPKEIHLVCIGPLTNAALAFLKEPRLAENLASLTIMGGVIGGIHRLDLPYCEHNILCDPEAAHIVFSSKAPITLIPLDLTTQVRIDKSGFERIRAAHTPFHDAVAGQLERYPRFQLLGWTNTHDPLAVATLIDPNFVELKAVHLDIETAGRHTAGATLVRMPRGGESPTVQLGVSVNAAAFETFLIERLER